MNLTLWICQGLLATIFAGSGFAKGTMSPERMAATGQTGVVMFPLPVVRFTAACEVAAAVGLIIPGLFGAASILTPLAAVGLCAVMVGAAWAHSKLREPWSVLANVVLFALALVVAVGRF